MTKFIDEKGQLHTLTPKEACQKFKMIQWIDGVDSPIHKNVAIREGKDFTGKCLVATDFIPKNTIIGAYTGSTEIDPLSPYQATNPKTNSTIDALLIGNVMRFVQGAMDINTLKQKISLTKELKWSEIATSNVEIVGKNFQVRTTSDVFPYDLLFFDYGPNYWVNARRFHGIDFRLFTKKGELISKERYLVNVIHLGILYPGGPAEGIGWIGNCSELQQAADHNPFIMFEGPLTDFTYVTQPALKSVATSNNFYAVLSGLPKNALPQNLSSKIIRQNSIENISLLMPNSKLTLEEKNRVQAKLRKEQRAGIFDVNSIPKVMTRFEAHQNSSPLPYACLQYAAQNQISLIPLLLLLSLFAQRGQKPELLEEENRESERDITRLFSHHHLRGQKPSCGRDLETVVRNGIIP